MVCGWIDLIFPITSLSGTPVALPTTPLFFGNPGRPALRPVASSTMNAGGTPFRSECAFTRQQSRRVIDLTRAWLQQNRANTPQMC
jgi:hypothetical protein